MIVPYGELSAEALTGLIEEYVTRDGTELSEAADKAAAVRRALEAGEAVIVYDVDSETCNILPADEVPPAEPEIDPDPDAWRDPAADEDGPGGPEG